MRIQLTAEAARDLQAISEPLYSRLLARLELLRAYPEMGQRMAWRHAGYRSTIVRPIRIVYRVLAPALIEIAYFRDCRRKPK